MHKVYLEEAGGILTYSEVLQVNEAVVAKIRAGWSCRERGNGTNAT